MESHPSYPALASLIRKYPRSGGALFQTYNDLALAQRWTDVEVLDLVSCSRGAFRGRRPQTVKLPTPRLDAHTHTTLQQNTAACVFPCSLSESLSTALIESAFSELGDPPEMYVAITSEDSSIVYYKFSTGIVKPQL